MKNIIVLIAFGLVTSSEAYALPLAPKDAESAAKLALSFPAAAVNYNFEGIVALNNCSGAIIRLQASVNSDPALVLTNGHCLEGGMPSPGEVITNAKSNRRFMVSHPETAARLGAVTATKIMYSTMTGTDMTIYVLKETYEDIRKKFNIRPLMLADRYPNIGESIDVVSGYWKRGYTCKVEQIIPTLKEGGYTMSESIRYSRPGCNTIGGTSGSPIISVKTGEVVGVNNTGNEDGQMCTMNNPCEIDQNGKKTAVKGHSYGQQTHLLYDCLSSPTTVDLNLPHCRLAK